MNTACLQTTMATLETIDDDCLDRILSCFSSPRDLEALGVVSRRFRLPCLQRVFANFEWNWPWEYTVCPPLPRHALHFIRQGIHIPFESILSDHSRTLTLVAVRQYVGSAPHQLSLMPDPDDLDDLLSSIRRMTRLTRVVVTESGLGVDNGRILSTALLDVLLQCSSLKELEILLPWTNEEQTTNALSPPKAILECVTYRPRLDILAGRWATDSSTYGRREGTVLIGETTVIQAESVALTDLLRLCSSTVQHLELPAELVPAVLHCPTFTFPVLHSLAFVGWTPAQLSDSHLLWLRCQTAELRQLDLSYISSLPSRTPTTSELEAMTERLSGLQDLTLGRPSEGNFLLPCAPADLTALRIVPFPQPYRPVYHNSWDVHSDMLQCNALVQLLVKNPFQHLRRLAIGYQYDSTEHSLLRSLPDMFPLLEEFELHRYDGPRPLYGVVVSRLPYHDACYSLTTEASPHRCPSSFQGSRLSEARLGGRRDGAER